MMDTVTSIELCVQQTQPEEPFVPASNTRSPKEIQRAIKLDFSASQHIYVLKYVVYLAHTYPTMKYDDKLATTCFENKAS